MFTRHAQMSGLRRLGAAALLLSVLLLVVAATGTTTPAVAGDGPERLIRLQTADVSLRPGVYDADGRYVVLQLGHNLLRADVEALAASGVRLLSYLGDGAFIAGVDPGALTVEVSAAYDIRAAAPWTPANKAAPALRRGDVDASAQTEAGLLKLVVLFFADVTESEMRAILGRHAATFRPESPPLLWSVEIAPAELTSLLSEQGIHVVEAGPIPFLPALDNVRKLIHADEVQQATITGPIIQYAGLTGQGIRLQVSEDAWDGHPDFITQDGQWRFVNSWPGVGLNHGTLVGGIMAGDGELSYDLVDTPYYAPAGRWRGIAPEATLVEASSEGIDASNHSYCMWEYAVYGLTAASVDRDIRGDGDANEERPQVWSACNQGTSSLYNDEEGYYSIYTPAKNNIVVGSVNDNDASLSDFSSLGPTFDGRIKPDLMAPGGSFHLPPSFDLYNDRIDVSIDSIQIVDVASNRLDRGWLFTNAGDTQGWFEDSGNTYNIFNVTAANGALNFEAGDRPEGGNQDPWGWNMDGYVTADPDHFLWLRYKMSLPEGSTRSTMMFMFHRRDDPSWQPSGSVSFDIEVDGAWHLAKVPLAEWATAHEEVGAWQGIMDRLGLVVFQHNMPGISGPGYYGQRSGSDVYAYTSWQGTSFSAPVVTGSTALLLQQFRDGHGLDLATNPPLPSTVKAVLLQTATDLVHASAFASDFHSPDTGAPVLYHRGPDFATGYGLIDIQAAVDLVADDPGPGALERLIHEGNLDGDQINLYEFRLTAAEIAALNGPLKFTLAWDDYPGDPTLPAAASQLVNDLDLYLIAPDGAIHYPWTLDPLPAADCGGAGLGCGDPDPIAPEDVQPAYRAADHRNNVEMVEVDSLMPGRWQVVVGVSGMPFPMQRYSLAGNHPMILAPIDKISGIAPISFNQARVLGNGDSDAPAISASGDYVAFESWANNLVPGDTNATADVFVLNWNLDQQTRVSVSSTGQQANGESRAPAISADGWSVAFSSRATNLVANDRNGASDIFVRDLHTGETSRVSVDSTGKAGNGDSSTPSIGGFGYVVAFRSLASNLVPGDSNGVADIFVHHLNTGQTTRVSLNTNGIQGTAAANHPALSASGGFVAFDSASANLVNGDGNGTSDVFVHDRQTGQTTRVSVSSSGQEGNGWSDFPALSGDGRFVVFRSDASNLVAGDSNGVDDVFVHDRQTGQTTRVSVSSSGTQGNSSTYEYGRPAISADGRYVTFDSEASNLVAGDDNGTYDVFRHDLRTGQTNLVSSNAMGTPGHGWSGLSALSADGRFVAYTSAADNLIGRDANHSSDIFIAERLHPPTTGDPEAVLSVGVFHTCALKPHGRVDCWGRNTEGQAAGQPGPFVQVSAGGYHTCALRTDGEVVCWGSNEYGQLSPPAGPFVQISSGRTHSCGLRPDGGVACWGESDFGLIEDHPIPFGQISSGDRSACGQSPAGRVWCWSSDDSAIGSYVQISAGGGHVCGLRASGAIDCWGANGRGEAEHPDGVFSQVTLGFAHTCALRLNGEALCWGYGEHGQTTPPAGPFSQLSAAWDTSCGLRPDGSVDCWGRNDYGQAQPQPGPYGPYDPSVNAAPVAANRTVVTGLNTPVAVTLSATDDDGDLLTFAVVAPPQHGTLSGSAPHLTYTPATGYSGPDSFTYQSNDGITNSNVATVSITVEASAIRKVYLPMTKR